MTTGISAIQASASVPTTSLGVRQKVAAQAVSAATPAPQPKVTQGSEDTVQLSKSAQQFVKASQSSATESQSLIEQIVEEVAAGDRGALALLTLA